MAEGGLKPSRSAEDLDKPGKPGKLSHDLLNKFTSDPALTGPLQPLPVGRLSAQSFLSSSEETAASQENLKSKTTGVRIKVPDPHDEHLSPSSADEDMLSDDEAGKEKKKKKRKLRWKWSPFKKMRSLFRRRKSPTRAKSCEELPTERYKPTYLSTNIEDNDSLRNRTKSEPSLVPDKTKTPLAAAIEVHERRSTVDNPVQRTNSDPSNKAVDKLFKGLKSMRDQGDISEEPAMLSDKRESQAESTNSASGSLDWSIIISSESGTEGAVSFESLPSASSLEGLQAAHDKIKIAPKHRRPPSRVPPAKSSSMNLKNNPVKPHRRSKTDPKDLTMDKEQGGGSTVNSDVISGTIFETLEISDEQSKEKVLADLKVKANDLVTNACESPKVGNKTIVNGTEEEEGDMQVNSERNKQNTTDIKQPGESAMNNINNVAIDKENKSSESKQSLQLENVGEQAIVTEKVLKELNGKKESRPVLDLSRRSESLQIFEVTGKSAESGTKPPLRKGLSLNSFESKETTADIKHAKLLANEKQLETSQELDKSTGFQNSAEKIKDATFSQEEPRGLMPGTLLKSSDEKVLPSEKIVKKACDDEESSEQPAWIKLANRRSERLSQLIDEGGKEDNKALLKMAFDAASPPASTTRNDGDKPHKPLVKEKPKVPTKPEGLSHKAALGKPHPRRKTFSGTTEKEAPIMKALSQDKPTVHSGVDKCVVCGTTVYQMEKCNFDSSILHRQCIKCTVCRRLLTVGNFIMSEDKVYCKPHAKTVTVSM